ncbi:hypothetical protein [Streptomyces solicavernae]|uniref:hypothetical protein n=1 Tax=Streptomyces solicavernae TaxID=3043614 RepID=UPI0038CF3A5D
MRHSRRGCADRTVGPEVQRRAVDGLREDPSPGRWAERDGDLLALDAAEFGLRLLVG